MEVRDTSEPLSGFTNNNTYDKAQRKKRINLAMKDIDKVQNEEAKKRFKLDVQEKIVDDGGDDLSWKAHTWIFICFSLLLIMVCSIVAYSSGKYYYPQKRKALIIDSLKKRLMFVGEKTNETYKNVHEGEYGDDDNNAIYEHEGMDAYALYKKLYNKHFMTDEIIDEDKDKDLDEKLDAESLAIKEHIHTILKDADIEPEQYKFLKHFLGGATLKKFGGKVLFGMGFGMVFGFIDNFGLFFGMDELNILFSGLARKAIKGNDYRAELAQAGLGNTYSDTIGATIGTFVGVMMSDVTGYDGNTPWYIDMFGVVLGCLVGQSVANLIKAFMMNRGICNVSPTMYGVMSLLLIVCMGFYIFSFVGGGNETEMGIDAGVNMIMNPNKYKRNMKKVGHGRKYKTWGILCLVFTLLSSLLFCIIAFGSRSSYANPEKCIADCDKRLSCHYYNAIYDNEENAPKWEHLIEYPELKDYYNTTKKGYVGDKAKMNEIIGHMVKDAKVFPKTNNTSNGLDVIKIDHID